MRKLNVFFDVDNTLIMWNGKLRNHVREVFEQLRESGHTIYVWSGVGIRRREMERHDLDHFVEDYFLKPLDRHHERLEGLGVPMTPDFVIDDHKGVVDAFTGFLVTEMPGPDDRELLDALIAIEEMALGDTEEPLSPDDVELDDEPGSEPDSELDDEPDSEPDDEPGKASGASG